jgi:hypothetical protein
MVSLFLLISLPLVKWLIEDYVLTLRVLDSANLKKGKYIYMKFVSFIGGLFKDEKGSVSMKRLCGLVCTITLCATLYVNSFTESHFAPSTPLVDAVALLAFGCLGLTSVEKIMKKKEDSSEA